MGDSESPRPTDRVRVGWWLFVALLVGVAAYIANAFVGLLVTGVFGYYATRPINDRLNELVDSDAIAAAATVLVVILPILFIAMLEAVRIVLPDLPHGERLTTTAEMGGPVGTNPREEGPVPTDDPDEAGDGRSPDDA